MLGFIVVDLIGVVLRTAHAVCGNFLLDSITLYFLPQSEVSEIGHFRVLRVRNKPF